ncbi:hypothetical protein IBX65_08090, partial [Candidatus Aerophobetes bacterium]|nr:hypothetical protein [Candidatus Aerophobetes bacterium]
MKSVMRNKKKMSIETNIRALLKDIPEYVSVVAAAKNRAPREIQEAIDA